MKLNVAHVSVPKAGEKANGDRAFHRRDDSGRSLLAVIDGLGHGPEAEKASLAGLDYLRDVSLESSLHDIMLGLHEAMRGTRGAAGTICLGNGQELQACAVGNVELRPIRTKVPLISSAGILGVRVRKFRVCQTTVGSDSRLLLYSDGIKNPTQLDEYHRLTPSDACDEILRRYLRGYDDATVLVADVE